MTYALENSIIHRMKLKYTLLTLCALSFSGLATAEDAASKEPKPEWKRTDPDLVVYLPKGKSDTGNEHFLVFEAPHDDGLMAIWTQCTVEGRGDNRAAFAHSKDGVNWSEPKILKGRGPGRADKGQASWAFPVVASTGRIYCFFTKETPKTDQRQAGGVMGSVYSDDNGKTWTDGADFTVPKVPNYDHPDPDIPPNWIVWQKPIRDAKGRWIVGYSRTCSTKAIPKPGRNWVDIDTRSGFIRFDNLDEGPEPKDLKLTWLPKDDLDGLEVPHKLYPQIAFSQEPTLVLLPDGRLFTSMRTMTGHIWYSVSDDHGDTWREPEVLRYKDGGKTVDNPVAPCPLYRLQDGRYLLFFNNNNGTRGEFSQFSKKKWRVNNVSHLRNPMFMAVGEFRKDAHQPIWFSEPKKILDTEDVIYGPKKTISAGMYPSLTEYKGKRVLWYPDRKHFLLGKYIPDALLEDMTVPEP